MLKEEAPLVNTLELRRVKNKSYTPVFMERSAGTVSAIKALGYPGSRCLSRCRCDELPCPLLSWLCAELRTLCPELRDISIQSILYLQERSAALASAPNLASLIGSSQVSPSLLLAAREDQSFIDPVKAGTSTSVYKTLMGSVPDRGGRPGEIEPPMPAWTGRSSKGNRGGRGGGQSHKHKKKKGKKD
ncbi:protein FAM98B-like [Pundamilia nyererei]|uniref:Protein FAM98B-like n=1 Tax=Pundamilia nyererei TaxID=303518 RepID=A0A9Y3QQD2_9CICH|nr:PREDICTED: protein FAM98B-like [Pundamilia nyererei]